VTAADTFAEFANALTYEEIPAPVREAAKLHVLDAIGCGLAALALGEGTEALQVVAETAGKPESTAVGWTHRLPAASAALANGMLCHALDYDDTHTAATAHVSTVVVPAALAAAQAANAGGRETLVAIIAANEIVVRLGMAAPFAFHRRGFHPTSVCGVFGAAAAAARLYALDRAAATNALGISGSMASGIFAYLADGSATKPLHAGWAAQSGVMAANLASRGATGPAAVLEGRFGVLEAYADADGAALAEQLSDLGSRWETPRIAFKPYPACHFVHASLDAMRDVMSAHAVAALDIDRIVVRIPQDAVALVLEPVEHKVTPRTAYDAKFSLQYSVAAMLRDGRVGVDTYTTEHITDPEILDLARRVDYQVIDFESYPRAFPGGVVVTTVSGDRLEAEVPYQRGGEQNPMTEADVVAKFGANAALALSEVAANRLQESILGLDGLDDVAPALQPLGDARWRPSRGRSTIDNSIPLPTETALVAHRD
jgi:2-methylcitrate dehydratase PrpD